MQKEKEIHCCNRMDLKKLLLTQNPWKQGRYFRQIEVRLTSSIFSGI